jgi:putative ABC transport system permease protein
MNIGQAVIEAIESLAANKLRSALTILGIIIGVGAVIAMLAIGQGAQDSITGSINSIGTNLLFVFSGNQQSREEIRNPKPLTISDANAIGDKLQVPSVEAVAPVIQGNAEITYGGEKLSTTIYGVTAPILSVRNYEVVEGNFITSENELGQASVAVIGPDAADKLFGRKAGVTGETIRINGQPFRVIGVLASKGGGAMGSQDQDILVPFSTAQARLIHRRTRNQVDIIYIQAISADAVTQAANEVTELLRTRHRTELGIDDFTVYTQEDIVSTAQSITGILTIFLGGIAAISLLVGGIGIMNIMLVSVTERTREIGLRKALGARRRDILTQFLTESSLLSLLGGIIGILLGWLISIIVGQIAAASGTPFNPSITLDAILLATLFSTAVGLFFGIYPANRAARLEPVEALRYE